MDNDKVNAVLLKYRDRLAYIGYAADRHAPDWRIDRNAFGSAFMHILWMCEEASAWGPERIEKKMRWLGFVQGALWALGLYTIDELKADNMPSEGEHAGV